MLKLSNKRESELSQMVDTDSRNTHTLSLVGMLSNSQHRHNATGCLV